MTIEVRPVRPAEHAQAGALTLAACDELGDVTDTYRVELLDVAGRIDDDSTVLVAVEADEVLGTVTVVAQCSAHFEHGDHGDGGFRMLAVAPEAQGRGIGRALLRAALDHGRAAGWRRLAITSMEWMPAAHRMYEEAGFDRRRDLDVRFGVAGVGCGFTLDLVPDVADAFPTPGPIPDEVPEFVASEWRPTGC